MFALHEGGVPVVDPTTADGVFALAWLVIALPAAGAAILLIGGAIAPKQFAAFGHLLGTILPLGSFAISLAMFVALLGRADDDRQVVPAPLRLDRGPVTLHVGMDLLYDPLTALFLLLITGVGSLIHIYSIGYMEHDPRRVRFFGYLNLFVAAMLMLVMSENYLGAVPRLGGRRPRVVPPDRLLAAQALRGRGGQEGLRDQPGRRHGALDRDHAGLRRPGARPASR